MDYRDAILSVTGMCYRLRMEECGHSESFAYHPELNDPMLHHWVALKTRSKCGACWREEERRIREEMYSRPWDYGFSSEELAFYDQAVRIYKELGRPVTENEALQAAFDDGYDLDIMHDPRWRRVSLSHRDSTGKRHSPTYELIPVPDES